MKYPPVPLVLVHDGDLDGLSSSPHLLPHGVTAEQGKASQLVLTGTVEICKEEKQDQKGFTPAMTDTFQLFCSVAVPSEHSQDFAAGVYSSFHSQGKVNICLGIGREWTAIGTERCWAGLTQRSVWIRVVFLPAPLSPGGIFPEGLKVHHATRREEERPHCAVWSPRDLSTSSLAWKGLNEPWVCLICSVQAITDQICLCSVGWSERYLFSGPAPSP